jgi:hypothetical protein
MAPLHLENFIGGAYVQARTDRCTELVDPSTGEVFGDAPTSGQADVDLAYESAAKAFESWRSTTPAQRQGCAASRAPHGRSRPGVVSCSRWRPEQTAAGEIVEVTHTCGISRRNTPS